MVRRDVLRNRNMFQFKIRRSNIVDSLKWLFLIISASYLIYQHPFERSHQHQNHDKLDNSETTIAIDRLLLDYLIFHLRDAEYDGVENYTRFMTVTRGLKTLTNVEPLMPDMGPVVNDITSFQYPIDIGACPTPMINNNNNARIHRSLFIAVVSAPNNFERRTMIRQTWPNHLKNQSNIYKQLNVVGFGFVIGLTNDSAVQQTVVEESKNYGDILQINIMDKYVDLSMKVASLLYWVNTYCPSIDYLLKVDDDVYVNVHNLATVIHSLTPSERSVYGRQCGENVPARSGGKWPTSFENWPWQRFPIYFQGAGLIIAGSAVRPLLAAMQTTPYFIWDDMYLIGLCAVKARIHLRTSNQIFIDQPEDYADPCFVRNSVMWTTPSADRMNTSHFASHSFYYQNPKKLLHCFLGNGSYTDDPASASEFSFGLIKQN